MSDEPDDSEPEIFDVQYMDPETVGEIVEIGGRCEEIVTLHKELCKADGGAEFSYRKLVYEDATAEIVCVCDACGTGEVADICERTPDGPEWSIVREDGLN